MKYVSMGLSVIPIKPFTKVPSIRSWREFQTRIMTPDEVEDNFNLDDNIALICGAISGITTVDLDDYKKKSNLDLHSPLFVTTPRKGKHFYYRYREGGNTVNQKLATDIRSDGGYVLIPNSTVRYFDDLNHKDLITAEGNYTWNLWPTKEMFRRLPELPEEIAKQLYGSDKPYERFDVNTAIGVTKGGRNSLFYKASCSALRKNEDQFAAWEEVWALNATFKPPLELAEAKRTFESAVKFITSTPFTFPMRPPVSAQMPKPILQKTFAPVVERQGYRPTTSEQDLADVVKIFKEGKNMGQSTGYPELDNIMGGFLPGQSYLLFADTSVGKSSFVINMVVRMTLSGVKAMYFDLENSMDMTMERVLLVANKGEMTLSDWRIARAKRDGDVIDKYVEAASEVMKNLYVWDLNKIDNRYGEILWSGVKRCIEEGVADGVKYFFIDHLHYFSPAESDFAVLGEIAREINNLCALNGVSIMTLAHTKKGLITTTKDGKVQTVRPTVDFISGAGLIAKHTKNIIALRRNTAAEDPVQRAEVTVYVDKTKYGPAGDFPLEYNEDTLIFSSTMRGLSFNDFK